MELSAVPWPAVPHPAAAVVLPLGSTEQHGRHLPFDVDTAVAAELARRLCVRRTDLVRAPALAYGASGEHQSFPGTLSLGREALELALLELGRSASGWAKRFLVVNGHGGNAEPVRAAVERLRYEGRDAAWWSADTGSATDSHAGRAETSVLLALRPEAVGPDREPGNPAPLPDLLPRLRADGVAAVSPTGVLGDPAGATAAEGVELLNRLATRLDAAVGRWLAGQTFGGRLS